MTERERTHRLILGRYEEVERHLLQLIPLGADDRPSVVAEVEVTAAEAKAASERGVMAVHGDALPGQELVLEIGDEIVWTDRARQPHRSPQN